MPKDNPTQWPSPSLNELLRQRRLRLTQRRRNSGLHRTFDEEHHAHLRFLEGMEQFNHAIRQAEDLEQMMVAVLDSALALFGSDRAWLLFPCDPQAPTWSVPVERTRAEFPGAFAQGAVIETQPEAAEIFRTVLASEAPLAYDPRSGREVPADLVERFSICSQLLLAIHPKRSRPWIFGMHQCSHARIWSDEDRRLFDAVGRRLADALSGMLLLENLRESEEKHKLLIEATRTGYVIVDAEGRVTDANQEYARLSGRSSPSELIGRHVLEWTAEYDLDRNLAAFSQCLRTGSIRNYEVDHVAPDGQITPVELNASLLTTPKKTRIMAVCRDITERKQAEAELHEAARRKDEFLAMLSHELRNPLTPVRNSLFILGRAAPGSEQAGRALAVIERQVAHLTRLVDDLLDLTRIVRGKIRIQREELELGELVRRSVGDNRALFTQVGVELRLNLPPGPLRLLADPARLDQVLGNILQNAAKFTPRGGEVEVTVSDDRAAGTAVLTVRDTGVGIEAQFLERVFEPFTQADVTLDRSRGGLGLGLSLVKGLVELHQGTVAVASDGLGRGATFTVRLPLPQTGTPAAAATPPTAPSAARPRRVLVIEDNVDAADSLREALALDGHEVTVAYDGPAGLRRAAEFRPEVVLCDIGLPGMDGYAVARALRADETQAGLCLVAVTGYARPEDVRLALDAGFDRQLAKPPSLEQLGRLIAEAGGLSSPGAAGKGER